MLFFFQNFPFVKMANDLLWDCKNNFLKLTQIRTEADASGINE